MRYDILLSPEDIADLRSLRADLRSIVRDGIEEHLRHAPAATSRARIKRLRGLSKPQYRLRIDDIRVFYDITGDRVEILAIVRKADAADWLQRIGELNETDSSI